jgi:glycosyltransferase involved in cell wall biosynthesis
MQYIFVSSGPYPNGGAATNRHLAYAKGLVELGNKVTFLLLRDQTWKGELITDGITFVCLSADYASAQAKISKSVEFLKTVRKATNWLESNTTLKPAIVVLLIPNVAALLPISKKAAKLGYKVLHERTEYPFVVRKPGLLNYLDNLLYTKIAIHKFDGIFVINKALRTYFQKITYNRIPIEIINMLVDPERFEIEAHHDNIKTKITYCGDMVGSKDGISILIQSFAQIAPDFPNAELHLIGSTSHKGLLDNLQQQCNALGIGGRVVFKGSVSRDQIPVELKNSNFLVLARPANKQAEGGFPTKLGEYLATGNPVVVTNVGEIAEFLKDGVNAFISAPDSSEAFAAKLREALTSTSARQIGENGKMLVYNEFNYLTQARKLTDFVAKVASAS